jgi:hypothetical protein
VSGAWRLFDAAGVADGTASPAAIEVHYSRAENKDAA